MCWPGDGSDLLLATDAGEAAELCQIESIPKGVKCLISYFGLCENLGVLLPPLHIINAEIMAGHRKTYRPECLLLLPA